MNNDWTIDQRWSDYTADEHKVWTTLFRRQTELLPGRACDTFIEGMKALPLSEHQIPDFRLINKTLLTLTGWQVVAVPGLVPDEVFFTHLSNRRFPAGQFIRRASQLDYLEEPDIFHDVFGHLPMLLNPIMADFIQAYGLGGLRAQKLGVLKPLARVYWYTVEFGLVQQSEGLRIYGAGIASSFSESRFCLEDVSPNYLRFDLERVMRTEYRIDDFQESYFVLPDINSLLELSRIDFAPFYQRIEGQPAIAPGTVVSAGELIRKGTGAYHLGRLAPQ